MSAAHPITSKKLITHTKCAPKTFIAPTAMRSGNKYAKTTSAAEFIESNSVKVPFSGCWIWMKGVQKSGYGVLVSGGVPWQAHRLSFAAFNGPIHVGLLVCHKCDVPSCVNPDHLFLGDGKDNLEDCYAKNRRRIRITPQILAKAKQQNSAGLSYRQIAEGIGVNESAFYYWRFKK